MDYKLAFGYFVGKPASGWTNLLLATVCLLIPVVGPLVLLGYQAQVSERLIRDPDLRRYPDFRFDRFVDLLVRGLWPFLMNLLGAVVAVPAVLAMMVVFPMLAAGAGNNNPGAVLTIFLVMFGVIFVISLLLAAVLTPMMFHAELANRFDPGGAFRFAVSFLKLVGGRAVVAYVVYNILSMVVVMLGMLVLCVGIYPALTIASMAGQHLMVQLYLEYLDRGGVEIETEDESPRRRDDYEDDDYEDDRPRRKDDDFDDDYDDRPRRRR